MAMTHKRCRWARFVDNGFAGAGLDARGNIHCALPMGQKLC